LGEKGGAILKEMNTTKLFVLIELKNSIKGGYKKYG